MLKKRLLLACFFLPFFLNAQPINYNFNNYSAENGLSTNSIGYVLPDSYGFLWLATFDGLVRWDGYSFKKYKHEEADPRSLDNNIIYAIYEDSHKRLWVATIDGLSLYDRAQDAFIRCPIHPANKKVPVNAIIEDGLHQLWLGTSNGLCRYTYETRKAEWFTTESDSDVIFCITADDRNDLWLGTFNMGISKFSQATRQFQSFRSKQGDPSSLSSDKVRSILADSENNIWVGTGDKGVDVLNVNGQLVKRFRNFSGSDQSLQGTVSCIYEDKNHTMWIGVRGELVCYIRKGSSVVTALNNSSVNNNHEKLTSVTSISEDQFGNTWFASSDNGVFCTNKNKNAFRNYLYDPASVKGLKSTIVSCIYEDRKGKIWVGTNGSGLFQFDPLTNSITRPIPSLSANVLYDIKEDNTGTIWIASWGGGVIRYDPANGTTRQYLHDPKNENSNILNNIKHILPDDSLVWIGTHGEGLAAFNTKQNRFIHYKNNNSFAFSMHDPAWINHLFKDSRKRLWISTYGGLYIWDGKKLVHCEHSPDTSSISSNSVNMVAEDGSGNIWIAGESGLDRYDEVAKRFNRYTAKYDLPESMKGVVAAKNGVLWISSNDGIFSFDPYSKKVKSYDIHDGLPDNSFFQKSAMQSRSGEIYFGSRKGFTVFNPVELKEPAVPAHFYFTDLYVYNEPQYPGGKNSPLNKVLSFSDTIVLSPKQSFFSIGFEVINLYAPGKTRYSYKLDGLHSQWIDANGDRKISFMNLQPDNYKLEVRYTDMNGTWHVAPKTLFIKILPAWWQTWWFKLTVLVLCIALIITLFYIRTASIERRNRLLKEEVKKRTTELSVMNASLIEQNDEIKTQKENLEVSNEEIRRQSDKILAQQQHITNQNQELERSVEKLKELNDTKDHFFSILAHDLKNPVLSLTEITDFIKTNFNKINRKELEEYIEGMHKSSASVYDLLVNLLNWSRTQVSKMTPKPTAWPIAEIVEKNKDLLESLLKKKLICFESHVNRQHTVLADYDMIDAVLRNIIMNSIKFTDYNGKIEIHSAEKDNTIILRITDTGIGMNTDQLDRLFKLDKMQVSAGTAGEKGTGLGLIISREFIEANKGNIWVESTPGKGSSFYIQLPAADPSQAIYDLPANAGTAFHSRLKLDLWETIPIEKLLKIKGKKILIVDDNDEVRNYLKLIISDTFEIFEAANGKEALKIANETVPAVIITDLLMPDMNGLDFCKAVKSQTATSHIPVVFLTSQWEESMQVTGYEAGADIYLTKPVKKELLIQVVLNLLQNQERQRDRIFETLMGDNYLQADTAAINKLDEAFLNKLIKAIEANISEPNLDAKFLCKEMTTSRTVLYTKLKTLTGQTVHEFIKSIRLKKSIRLLLDGELPVSQVAFEVGFNSHSYFDKCFTKQYKMGPKEYISKRKSGPG